MEEEVVGPKLERLRGTAQQRGWRLGRGGYLLVNVGGVDLGCRVGGAVPSELGRSSWPRVQRLRLW
jgi:hypothetical protein